MSERERARDALRDRADEARVQRMWAAIDARRDLASRRSGRRWVPVGLSVAGVVVLVGGLLVGLVAFGGGEGEPGPLRLANGEPLPRALAADVALSDGSTVRVGPGARLDLLENGVEAVSFALREGRARFEVRPGGPRAWRVECGRASVHVVGTVFEVDRSAEGVRVVVERGAVVVRGPGVPDHAQRLEAGASLLVPASLATPGEAVADAALVEAAASEGSRSAASPGSRQAPLQPLRERSLEELAPRRATSMSLDPRGAGPRDAITWRTAASRARYEEAFQALGSSGVQRETERARGPAELWALADVARFSGHPEDAVGPLTRLLDEHPNDPKVALAAYTLGRIELESLDRPSDAARHLERSLALGLPEALREAALARRVSALGRAGRRHEAADAARAYLQDFPDGPNRARVEPWAP